MSNGDPLIIDAFRHAISRYGVVTEATVGNLPTGDAFPFFRKGYTVVQFGETNLWLHSSFDVIETLSPSGLEQAARAYADFLERVDGTDTAAFRPKK